MVAAKKKRKNPGITDAQVIAACNESGGPTLPARPTSAQIQRWLKWNDRNGDYDDVAGLSQAEAMDILHNVWDGELSANPRRQNPSRRANQLLTIQGHVVSRTANGYRVDAYGKVFTTKSACREWLKRHVAHEKKII
jgi:hypothetical protein